MKRRCCSSAEKVGSDAGPEVDIAVDPLEGTTLCAKNMPGAIATMAMAEGGTLLNAPDVYMQKIAVGRAIRNRWSILMHHRPKTSAVSPAPRMCIHRQSPRWCSTVLVTPTFINAIRSTGAAVAPDH